MALPAPSSADEFSEDSPPPVPSLDPAVDEDVPLMLDAARDSEGAFTALVQKHQKPLLNFFGRMGATFECEDLVQETFLRLYRFRQSYRPTARFATFLYHLARNVWADFGRKIFRIDRLAAKYEDDIRSNTGFHPDHSEESPDVEAALDQLSPKLREAIVLNVYQGLRYQEVADVLGIPLGTVKSRINLAMAALKDILRRKR